MKQRLDTTLAGVAMGLLGILLGIVITMVSRTGFGADAFSVFFEQFAATPEYRSNVLLFSVFPNPIIFFILMRLNMNRASNGVVITALLLAVYLVAINVL